MDHTKWLLLWSMKRNNWQENHQLTLKQNHSHCNHSAVVKTWQEVVSSILPSLVKKIFIKSMRLRKWVVIKITHAWHKFWIVISRRAHMLLACAIHHLKALTEGILVLKYPHYLFCFFWINIPQSFCLRFQCNYTLTLLVPCAPLFCWTLHNHNLPADWVRELFKPSKDVESLVVYIFF